MIMDKFRIAEFFLEVGLMGGRFAEVGFESIFTAELDIFLQDMERKTKLKLPTSSALNTVPMSNIKEVQTTPRDDCFT